MINKQYYYSEAEWDRLGCGPLPAERDLSKSIQHDTNPQYPVYPEDDGYDTPKNPYSPV